MQRNYLGEHFAFKISVAENSIGCWHCRVIKNSKTHFFKIKDLFLNGFMYNIHSGTKRILFIFSFYFIKLNFFNYSKVLLEYFLGISVKALKT